MYHTLPPLRKHVLMHSGHCTIHVKYTHVLTRAYTRVSQLEIMFKKVEYAKYILISFLHMLQQGVNKCKQSAYTSYNNKIGVSIT